MMKNFHINSSGKTLPYPFQLPLNSMILVAFCLLLSVSAALSGCQTQEASPSQSKANAASERPPLITVASPSERLTASAELISPTTTPQAGTYALSGILAYPEAEDVEVFAPVAGRIVKAYVSEATDPLQDIRQGQALYILESPEWMNAQLDYQLLESFNSINLYSTTESQAAQKAWKTKWRNAGIPESAIKRFLQTKKASDKLTITAPIAGHLHVEADMPVASSIALEGQEVAAGDALMRLTPMREMVALVPLSGGNPGIKVGDKVIVIGENAGSEAMVGVVEGYEPRALSASSENGTSTLPTLRIRVNASHDGGASSNMAMRVGARVTITPFYSDKPTAKNAQGLFLPASALLPLSGEGAYAVFVATGEGQTLAFRRVSAQRKPSGQFEVRSGLSAKDRVAEHPALLLDPETQILPPTNL
jgi:biotin carboxyl carrier protein